MDSAREYWQIDTKELAEQITSNVRNDMSEEDVKMVVEPLLRNAFVHAGIDVSIAIPAFDPASEVHLRLTSLSQQAHARVARGQPLDELDRDLTIAVKDLWNIAH